MKKPYRNRPATSAAALKSYKAPPKTQDNWNALLAPNIIEHLRLLQSGDRATDHYFRLKSKFFDALREHVRTAKDSNCVIEKNGRSVACHRGTGYAVSLKRPIVHFALPGETEMMSFELHVGFEPGADDPERETDFRDVERDCRLYCPTDLILNFTKEKFNLWTKTMRAEIDKENLKKERRELDRLLKRHPNYATEKLLKTKPSAS